jgi:polar amino acid transport system substrate-binding protein
MVENGRVTGLSTEVVQAVLREVDMSPRIEVLPWARAYDLSLHTDNVLIYSIARTPQREHLFKWVGVIAPAKWFFYSLATHPIVLHSLADARHYKIATVKDDAGEQYLLAEGFKPGKELQSGNVYDNNYRKLKAGRVELWISNELNAISLMKKHGDDVSALVRSLELPELSNPNGLLYGL